MADPSSETAVALRRLAAQARYLVDDMTSEADNKRLRKCAEELEAKADELERHAG
jgi:hypothetical protein